MEYFKHVHLFLTNFKSILNVFYHFSILLNILNTVIIFKKYCLDTLLDTISLSICCRQSLAYTYLVGTFILCRNYLLLSMVSAENLHSHRRVEVKGMSAFIAFLERSLSYFRHFFAQNSFISRTVCVTN